MNYQIAAVLTADETVNTKCNIYSTYANQGRPNSSKIDKTLSYADI